MAGPSLPLIIVALGGALLVLARHNRLSLGALALQWLGLFWASASLAPDSARPIAGMSTTAAVELLTAVVSIAIMWLTLRGLHYGERPSPAQSSDYLLRSAAVLMAGVAGAGFAALFPLGLDSQFDLVLYWGALAGALALILEGSRSPVKLAAGLLALLNATALLVYILSDAAPGAGLLGLLSACRIALASLMAYLWLLLAFEYDDLSLDPLFTRRDAAPATTMALAVAVGDGRWTTDDGRRTMDDGEGTMDGQPAAGDGDGDGVGDSDGDGEVEGEEGEQPGVHPEPAPDYWRWRRP
jgi:hypothetical protein